uniref:EF-hand domain-containing protein n=1 Tax=Nannospalax galili TaxID=1026970 RepID=A0A8C6W2V5_NANGA
VKVKNLKTALENKGITLREKEHVTLLKSPPISKDGMVYKKSLLDSVVLLKGKKVHICNLPMIMGSTNINLEKEEYEGLINHLPIDENEIVDLNVLMDEAKTFTGEKVAVSNLNSVMRKMGLMLTNEEFKELLEKLSVYNVGKIHKSRLLKVVKELKGPRVKIKVKSLLESMGIRIKDEELEELMIQLPTNGDRTVGLNDLMDTISHIKAKGMMSLHNLMIT